MWQLMGEHLSATFYRRPYYRMMREILGDHRSARHGRLYALDCAIFLYAHRLLWLAYVVQSDFKPILGDEDMDTNNNTKWNDLVLGYAYANRENYDTFIFVAIYLFAAFYWFCETTYWRVNPRRITWLWWYFLVVNNLDAYRDAALPSEVLAERRRQIELGYSGPRIRMLVPSVAKAVYCSIAGRVRLWWTLSNVDQRRLFAATGRPPHSMMPNLSPQLRRLAILFLVIADYVALAFQAIIVIFIFFIVVGFVLRENTQMYSRFALIWVCVEIYITHYAAQRLVRSAIFFTYCSILGTIVYCRHVIETARPVGEIIRRHRIQIANHNNHNNQNTFLVAQRATQFAARIPESAVRFRTSYLFSYAKYGHTIEGQLAEHNKVCYLVMRGSEEMFGNVMFAFMLTNLPINVYLIQRITFQTLVPLDLAVMIIVFLAQIIAASLVIFPLALCCEIFHLPKRFIPALQTVMRTAKWLSFKLKYDDLYGRLVTEPKLGVSIGPMDAITYMVALESISVYVAFILMAFNRKIASKLQLAEV